MKLIYNSLSIKRGLMMDFETKSIELKIGEKVYTNNISEGSMNLSRILCDSNIIFGKPFADMFECTVFDENGFPDVKGQRIQVTITKTDGTKKNIFTGTIESSKADSTGLSSSFPTGYYRDIIAYDDMYEKGQKDVSQWWEDFWQWFSHWL